uniref:L1 transposable element RRM domain-containing protein n=1 Tax=Sphaeramia orbicularis TaxID=375764 RepID=A0A672ZD18_9TELE
RDRLKKPKKPLAANSVASMDDGDNMSFEESVANMVSKTVTEKIGALMKQKFTKLVKILTDRAEDSENRSHRDNIRIIGLKEGAEENQAIKFFGNWLPDTLGLETKRGSIKIDWVHRALGLPKKNCNRPVIIKLHYSSDKQWILAAIREKGKITYRGDKIYFRQDLSTQVKEARRQFSGVCEHLIQRGLRFQMRYPATLCFTLCMSDLKVVSLNVKGINHVIKRQKILSFHKKRDAKLPFSKKPTSQTWNI